MKKALPIGAEFFDDIINKGVYYVDKTGLIKELLENNPNVTLFTRPRRFGKSLNMSMLKCFFEIGTDKHLFDGLSIAEEKELCERHMGQYPVIWLTLKDVCGMNYNEAQIRMKTEACRELRRHYSYLKDSDKLNDKEKKTLDVLYEDVTMLPDFISALSELLYKHFGKRVIVLIDEYDVPLQKAETRGYYDEMVSFISNFFSQGMKTNSYIEKAIVTGCLRVAKESIFTGFNNVAVFSIADNSCADGFGFTETEVEQMFSYYGVEDYLPTAKEWYDGYLFGETHVYCPWDIVNWCSRIVRSNDAEPQNFWSNSSGNDIIKRFADMADDVTRNEISALIDGGSIWKKLRLDLTYRELDASIDNLWSVLFTTGYLTQKSKKEGSNFELVIPNREIRNLFEDQVSEWFKETLPKDASGLETFLKAIAEEDTKTMTRYLNTALKRAISVKDDKEAWSEEERIAAKSQPIPRETFYHGFMLGILNSYTSCEVTSNREAGNGYLDIAFYDKEFKWAAIFELKRSKSVSQLKTDAQKALKQIDDKHYDEYYMLFAPDKIIHYGVAFCKKDCLVMKEEN